jgi:hypothetical protein
MPDSDGSLNYLKFEHMGLDSSKVFSYIRHDYPKILRVLHCTICGLSYFSLSRHVSCPQSFRGERRLLISLQSR